MNAAADAVAVKDAVPTYQDYLDADSHPVPGVLGLRWQAGATAGELTWARAIGTSPTPRHGQWQAQTSWWF